MEMQNRSKYYGLFNEDGKYSIQKIPPDIGKNKGEIVIVHYPLNRDTPENPIKRDLPENPTHEEIVVSFAENIALKSKETWLNLGKPVFYKILGENRASQILAHIDDLKLSPGEDIPM